MARQNAPESAPQPPELPPELPPEVAPVAPPDAATDAQANPAAMPMEQLARMLGLSIDDLCRHVAQGTPTNANGSINLVHYAAWLNTDTGRPVAEGGSE